MFTSVLNAAIDDGLLARSPCHRIELPAAVVPVIEPLTPAQILTLATLIDPRYHSMLLLAAGRAAPVGGRRPFALTAAKAGRERAAAC